jgi:acyl-ACP thioesterase
MADETHLIHRDSYRVTSWDADIRGRLSPAALGRYLQESAIRHAAKLGYGMAELQRDGLTWVVGALLVRIARYPRHQQKVVLETWPRPVAGRRAPRDFRLVDADGAELAAVSGAYLLIDLTSRRAAALERFGDRKWRDERALDRDARRVTVPADAGPQVERGIPLRWSDIDLLGHVTNTRYLDLALETYPPDFLADHEVAEMEMNFVAEGRYPGVILSRRWSAPGAPTVEYHSLVHQSDGRELYRARLVWRPA